MYNKHLSKDKTVSYANGIIYNNACLTLLMHLHTDLGLNSRINIHYMEFVAIPSFFVQKKSKLESESHEFSSRLWVYKIMFV